MNVYDFDNTILRGDSSARFFAYCMKHYPKMWWDIPGQAFNGLFYILSLRPKRAFKQRMFAYLRFIPDIDAALEGFWKENLPRIKRWYKQQHKPNDVVITASPEFLVRPACEKLGIHFVIGTTVDKHTGKFNSQNCHGAEKVGRFREQFPVANVEAFYSDSRSDAPMAELAKEAFLVKGDRIIPW